MLSTNCAKYKHQMCGASAHPLRVAREVETLDFRVIRFASCVLAFEVMSHGGTERTEDC